MRSVVDRAKVERVMRAFARAAGGTVRVHLVGGTSAVLFGWRSSTVDVDFVLDPEDESLLRAIPDLKEQLQVNVEMASPAHFIPVLPGWEERGHPIQRIGSAEFLHYDLYAQALAKVERGHTQDLEDVRQMLARGLVEPAEALAYFQRIEPELYRYPAIDAPTFQRAVERMFSSGSTS